MSAQGVPPVPSCHGCQHWRQDPSGQVIEIIHWGACRAGFTYRSPYGMASLPLTRRTHCCSMFQPLNDPDVFRHPETGPVPSAAEG